MIALALAAPTASLLTLLAAVPPPTAQPIDGGGKVPLEGVGLLVGGAIAIGGGIGLIANGYTDCPDTDPTCRERDRHAYAYAGFGITAAGVGLLTAGAIMKRRFNGWRDARKLRVPKRGNGMFVGGGAMIGTGVLALAVARDAPVAAIFGTIATLGGAGLVAGGAVLRVRYRRWRDSAGFSYAMAPMMLPRGGGLGMHARF